MYVHAGSLLLGMSHREGEEERRIPIKWEILVGSSTRNYLRSVCSVEPTNTMRWVRTALLWWSTWKKETVEMNNPVGCSFLSFLTHYFHQIWRTTLLPQITHYPVLRYMTELPTLPNLPYYRWWHSYHTGWEPLPRPNPGFMKQLFVLSSPPPRAGERVRALPPRDAVRVQPDPGDDDGLRHRLPGHLHRRVRRRRDLPHHLGAVRQGESSRYYKLSRVAECLSTGVLAHQNVGEKSRITWKFFKHLIPGTQDMSWKSVEYPGTRVRETRPDKLDYGTVRLGTSLLFGAPLKKSLPTNWKPMVHFQLRRWFFFVKTKAASSSNSSREFEAENPKHCWRRTNRLFFREREGDKRIFKLDRR